MAHKPGARREPPAVGASISRRNNTSLNRPRSRTLPFTSITGMRYDTGDYPGCVRLCADLLDLPKIRARQKQGEPDGRLIGVGCFAR